MFAPLTRAVAILGFSLTGGLGGQELDCFRQHSVCVAPRLGTLCSLFHFRLTTALILYFLTVERFSNVPRITPGRVRGPKFWKQAMGRPFPKVSERKAGNCIGLTVKLIKLTFNEAHWIASCSPRKSHLTTANQG